MNRLVLALIPLLCACVAPRPEYAIAIHGGAGTIPRDTPAEKRQEYEQALAAALERGQTILREGGSSLDAVEQVVRFLEDDPLFNAGKGAVFTSEGTNELDAAIMDGRDLSCGAVSGVKRIKHPITLARLIMTESRHVFLVGEGAETFASDQGIEFVPEEYFRTEHRYEQWRKAVEEEGDTVPQGSRGTVGAVALDRHGNLAAATSTGGLTNKRFGRVGDVPIIGAGTYAKNATCAVSCTGRGEEFIRHTVAGMVSVLIEHRGFSLEKAAKSVIHGLLTPGDGGLIAVSARGEIALVFNSNGMFRGAADSTGRFEVKIWE